MWQHDEVDGNVDENGLGRQLAAGAGAAANFITLTNFFLDLPPPFCLSPTFVAGASLQSVLRTSYYCHSKKATSLHSLACFGTPHDLIYEKANEHWIHA